MKSFLEGSKAMKAAALARPARDSPGTICYTEGHKRLRIRS